jgi:serine/threonine-protein kinase RsbW
MELVLELEIPARAEFIAIVRLVVASLASGRRALADERIDDLKLAVSEACTNAIEAQGAAERDDHVRIQVFEGDERLEVAVEDRGSGFDPELLPAHPPVTDPERLNYERGLGIPLIRSLVDVVKFRTSPEGTQVRMTLFGGPADGESPAGADPAPFEAG